MPTPILNHVASVLAIGILVSVGTAGAAIAASGIGHVLAGRPSSACGVGGCSIGAYQAKPAHVAKASASIALRGARGH